MRRELYPEILPYAEGQLPLADGHSMYWEQAGNRDGVPVLFLHGGPGAGTAPAHRRFFDPGRYRIVLFDQRGAGRSTPHADIAANTTAHLVADIEILRESLGIESWIVFGGSWGSTLGLAYAQAHPTRCKALVLRGIFLADAGEVTWFLTGMGHFFPDAWRDFVTASGLAPNEIAPDGSNLLAAYRQLLNDEDPAVHLPAARAWATYEARCSTLRPNPDAVTATVDGRSALAIARIEAHYLAHHGFVNAGKLIAGIAAIRHIPAVIVQGRYDVVCPPSTADRLAQAWPEARYVVVPDAGHSAMEPGIRGELVAAMESFKSLA